MQKKPRPHAELIRAWADGEEIRYRAPGETKWIYTSEPAWIEDYEYEIVPDREYPETDLSRDEICRLFASAPRTARLEGKVEFVVNWALRIAIDKGQVVTREEFDKLAEENDRLSRRQWNGKS